MCGYAVDFLRSCYRGTWNLPAADNVRGYYYFCDPGTPHYPDWHYFGSRNWHQGDGTPWPALGEVETIAQQWRDGSFPTTKPDARRIGTQPCIEGTGQDDIQPGPLIAGVDARCWQVAPPWGGLAAGGSLGPDGGIVSPHGLAGGGASKGAAVKGGLAGGGDVTIGRAPAIVQSATANAAGSNPSASITWGVATTAGNLLVVVATARSTNTVGGIAITAPAGWSQAIAQTGPLMSGLIAYLFYKENAASQSSTGNFQATDIGGTQQLELIGVEVRNCKTSASLDKTHGGTGSASHPATGSTGTLTQPVEIALAGFGINSVDTLSAPDNGFAIVTQKNGTSHAGAMTFKVVSATTALSNSVSPNETWAALIGTFKGV